MTSFKYSLANKIKENEIGWACGTYREEKNAYRCFPLAGDGSAAGFRTVVLY
jgi:hypothetical protein